MIKLKKEVKVGIFAIIIIVALYWGLNFVKGRDLFNRYNNYYATYEAVNGVQKSSAILIKGFKIGVVSNISYDPGHSDKVIVEFNIRSRYKIPENSKAKIFTDGLIGGKAIEIEPGDSPRYLEDGDTLRSEMDKGLFELAGSEIELMKQKLSQLVKDMTITLDNVNALFAANSDNITSMLGNLAGITGSVKRVVQTEEKDLQIIIKNISILTSALKDNSMRIDNILGNVDAFTDSLSRAQIPTMINNIADATYKLDAIMSKLNGTDGTLGKLINDERMYESLNEASANLALLLEDLKENPGRYVHFSLFGKKNK